MTAGETPQLPEGNRNLQNSEGLPAKHLPACGKFARQINAAGMAELVDARDLKTLADH
jgi:hypothetical protein